MDDRLKQALRTLRAIQQRYETGRNVDSDYIRSFTVQVALGYADMLWIAAAIEALEGVAGAPLGADSSTDAAASPPRPSQPQQPLSCRTRSDAFAAPGP